MQLEATMSASPEQLSQIGELVKQLREAQRLENQAEQSYKEAARRRRRIEELDIPAALAEAGLAGVITPDGAQVSVKSILYASIPKKNKAAVAQWLQDHDLGSLVKPSVQVMLNKGEHARLTELIDLMARAGYGNYSVDEQISTGAVKSAIRELTEEGVDVPLELFGAHWVTRAEIKDPR